jgi:hypothetical protein
VKLLEQVLEFSIGTCAFLLVTLRNPGSCKWSVCIATENPVGYGQSLVHVDGLFESCSVHFVMLAGWPCICNHYKDVQSFCRGSERRIASRIARSRYSSINLMRQIPPTIRACLFGPTNFLNASICLKTSSSASLRPLAAMRRIWS